MELRCPVCGEKMMKKKFGYWKCPGCGGEWWPDEEAEEKQILECFQDTLNIPRKRKSSGGSRKRKKEKAWVPLPSERYILQ